ncbi:MAG: PQQ-binding-like beta-propeller repeat protein [Methanomassiliicoccales archaeon]|jgi:outer membrane protein assembly factor BamB
MKFVAVVIFGLMVLSSLAIAPVAAESSSTCAVLFDFGDGQVVWSDVSLSPGLNGLNVTYLAAEQHHLVLKEDLPGYITSINGIGYNFTTGEYWNLWTWNSSRAAWDWSMVGAADVNPAKVQAIAFSYAASTDPTSFAPPNAPLATPDHRYPWTSFRHDSMNTGSQPLYTPNNLTLKWQTDLQNGAIDAPIVVAQGREYVVTGGVLNMTTFAYDTNSSLMCLDGSGGLIWKAEIGRGYQVGSPLLYGSMVIVPSANGKVFAFDAKNGSKLWSFDTASASPYGVVSSPMAYNNNVFVAASNGKVFSLNDKGEQNWNKTIAPIIYSSSPGFFNGTMYIGADDGKLHAIYANGTKEAWSTSIGGKVRGSPILLKDKIVVTFVNSTPSTGGLAAVGYDGKLLWRTVTGVSPASVTLTSKGFASIIPTGVSMIGFDGKKLWNISLGTSFAGAAPTGVNGTFFMVTNEATSRLLAISDQGELYYQKALLPAQYALSAPTVADGKLFVSCDNGHVYAFNLNNVAPVAYATWSVNDKAGHFVAQTSAGTLFHYSWDFGDGNKSTTPVANHTYAKTGSYNAVLTVTNPDGKSSYQQFVVFVNATVSASDNTALIVGGLILVVVVVVALAAVMVRRRK